MVMNYPSCPYCGNASVYVHGHETGVLVHDLCEHLFDASLLIVAVMP